MPNPVFKELRLADARITKLMLEGTTVVLIIHDWQEKPIALEFKETIGIEAFGVLNADLGSVTESTTDPLIATACGLAEEPNRGFQCYSLFSAWNEKPLIKIIARSWKIN